MSERANESADSVSEIRELQAQLERFRQLYHVTNVIHSTLDPQEALQLILSEAIRLTLSRIQRHDPAKICPPRFARIPCSAEDSWKRDYSILKKYLKEETP